MSAETKAPKCAKCGEEVDRHSWCRECKQYLCDACADASPIHQEHT